MALEKPHGECFLEVIEFLATLPGTDAGKSDKDVAVASI
jgi:hypothetical protein